MLQHILSQRTLLFLCENYIIRMHCFTNWCLILPSVFRSFSFFSGPTMPFYLLPIVQFNLIALVYNRLKPRTFIHVSKVVLFIIHLLIRTEVGCNLLSHVEIFIPKKVSYYRVEIRVCKCVCGRGRARASGFQAGSSKNLLKTNRRNSSDMLYNFK